MLIAPIVEGFGEVSAVPVLIRRIVQTVAPEFPLEVLRPHRIKRQKVVQAGELERVIEFTAGRLGQNDAIILLIDADDDCPALLGPELLKRAQAARPDRRTSVVLANREFEAWFVAALESLRGLRTIAADAAAPHDAEAIANPKGWIDSHMASGYSETVDQVALVAQMDFAKARQAPSFDKFWRDIARLVSVSGD